MRVYRRESYLKKIRPFYDDDIVKVVTGIRRCGKSCLMQSVREELVERGVPAKDIIYIDLDKRGYRRVKTPDQLEEACDFICRRHDDYSYVQVAMSIADRAVEDREYRPFSHIRDNYPQYLFTLDPLPLRRDGVRHLNLADFMADGGELLPS